MPAKQKPKGEMAQSRAGGVSPNFLAALSYFPFGALGALFVIVVEKENKFVRFHAFQSLLLNLLFIVTYVFVVGCFLSPIYVLYSIYLAYKAYAGERYKVPYIWEYAERQVA